MMVVTKPIRRIGNDEITNAELQALLIQNEAFPTQHRSVRKIRLNQRRFSAKQYIDTVCVLI